MHHASEINIVTMKKLGLTYHLRNERKEVTTLHLVSGPQVPWGMQGTLEPVVASR